MDGRGTTLDGLPTRPTTGRRLPTSSTGPYQQLVPNHPNSTRNDEEPKNWAGQPLESYETILNFLRTTKTAAGLVVDATLLDGDYQTGIKISQAQMDSVNLRQHKVLPMWNYTLIPTQSKM